MTACKKQNHLPRAQVICICMISANFCDLRELARRLLFGHHLQVRTQVQLLRLRLYWSKWCFRIRDQSCGTFWSWIRLPFTQKTWVRNQNFPVSSWIRKLLNLELKVETLYLDTYESEFPCSVNALRIWIPWMWWIRKHSWIWKHLL